MKLIKKIITWLIVLTIISIAFPAVVYADTDGTEIQITDQPDRLIIQFGPQWAGLEFKLKTDAGVYPAPVVVDSTGVLKMDLGGSKTYMLSCIASAANLLSHAQAQTDESQSNLLSSAITYENNNEIDNCGEIELNILKTGIPVKYLIIFIAGLTAAIVGLISMRYSTRQKKVHQADDEDDFE